MRLCSHMFAYGRLSLETEPFDSVCKQAPEPFDHVLALLVWKQTLFTCGLRASKPHGTLRPCFKQAPDPPHPVYVVFPCSLRMKQPFVGTPIVFHHFLKWKHLLCFFSSLNLDFLFVMILRLVCDSDSQNLFFFRLCQFFTHDQVVFPHCEWDLTSSMCWTGGSLTVIDLLNALSLRRRSVAAQRSRQQLAMSKRRCGEKLPRRTQPDCKIRSQIVQTRSMFAFVAASGGASLSSSIFRLASSQAC